MKLVSKRFLVIASSIIGLMIIMIIVVFLLVPRNNANLVISVTPVGSTIKIGQKEYSNGVFRGLPAGHYAATIEKEGFESKTVELNLENDGITYLNEYLVQSDGSLGYYETDSESLLLLREYSSRYEDEKVKTFLENYDKKRSIRDVLPIEHKEPGVGDYFIRYSEDYPGCKKIYCLEIGASDTIYYQSALSVLKIHGFEPDDYEIIDVSDRCD